RHGGAVELELLRGRRLVPYSVTTAMETSAAQGARRASFRNPRSGADLPMQRLLMDAVHKPVLVEIDGESKRPSREQAMEAVRTLIAWAGDDPAREGLKDTPRRVIDAYGDWFHGYQADVARELSRTFEEVQGYDDMVMLRDIEVESHCEHHMAPFLGRAWVAYVPTDKVVGISKIARVVEIFSKRLQTQETLTQEIAGALESHLA